MNRLLIICPTYQRKDTYLRMVDSFYEKSVCSDLITLTEQGSITKLINDVDISKYEYVGVTNDDVIYRSYAWDRLLIDPIMRKGYGIAFGDDGTQNRNLPSICIMSTNIPKALGWLQYPKLEHLCGDMVWQYIGKKLNCLYYQPHVKIEHMHFLFGKGDKKDYARTNSQKMYKSDNKIFEEWIREESTDDIRKIQLALQQV